MGSKVIRKRTKDYEIKLDVDIDFVIDEALKYDKIHEANIFINKSILNLKDEVVRTGMANGLKCDMDKVSNDEFFKIESNKRLPKNILDDEVKINQLQILFKKIVR